MCGFAGILVAPGRFGADRLSSDASAMGAAIRHRGPDSDGLYVDGEGGIALSHVRLAIIDLSPAGHQPMTSADGRYVIAYNGETYNFVGLREELRAKGHRFQGRSDTEVMLAAIVEWGLEGALGRFVGMFAFALWDRQERCLHLVRDRLGIKPVLYGRQGDTWLFGSELSALRAWPGFEGTVDRDALVLYLKRNCVPAPHSIYREVRKLPAGCIATLRVGQEPEVRPWWSLADVVQSGHAQPFEGDEAEATEHLEHLLGQAVGDRLVADVPLGVFLSGGIDSSLVAALAQSRHGAPMRTFSIGQDDPRFDESDDAAKVAEHIGSDHRTLMISDDAAREIVPTLGTMYDEPFSDSSQIPTFLVSRMAREDVIVALSGDGGDEVFGGYNRYVWSRRVLGATGWLPGGVRRGLGGAITAVPPDRWDAAARFLPHRNLGDKLHKLADVLDADDAGALYQRLVSHWPEAESMVAGGAEPDNLVRRRADWPKLSDPAAQMMYLDAMTYLPDDILTKVDRASMAVSLEARVPLLDHRVVAFAWTLPQSFKIAGTVTKSLLRQVLYRHVPPKLVERPKAGFSVPVDRWLRGPLRDWAEALLDEARLRREGFLDPAPIRARWTDHLSGRRNNQYPLWDVLMFQSWLEASR